VKYIAKKYGIPDATVIRMIKDGIIDWRIEQAYEFKLFYDELCKDRDATMVREECMQHFRLSKSAYYRALHRIAELFPSE